MSLESRVAHSLRKRLEWELQRQQAFANTVARLCGIPLVDAPLPVLADWLEDNDSPHLPFLKELTGAHANG